MIQLFQNFKPKSEIQILARIEGNVLHIATKSGYVLHLDVEDNICTLAEKDANGGCKTILKNKLEYRKFDIIRYIIQLARN